MSHASDRIQLKIDRANEHLERLNDEFGKALETEADKLFAFIERNPQTGWYESRVGDFRPDTARCSIIGGEIYYQLRSVLEHMVWALVKANRRKPVKGANGNTFPIRKTKPKDFVRETARKELKGIRRQAIKIIEEFQPYHAPDPSDHPLAIVKEFSDIDKHRFLLTSFVNATNPDQFRAMYTLDPPVPMQNFRRVLKRGQRLIPSTKIAQFRIAPPAVAKVYMNGSLSLRVAITDRRGGPDSDITDCITEVTRLFDHLKPYLGS